MADEAKSKGAHVILGPTINMQRSPLGGRGFESIGEDPVLAGLVASALINGIQSKGIQATIKHFVCNDLEHKRNATQAIVTDRALREIYAKPFQIAVRDSNPASFMTAYNGINGTYCSENKELLDGLLRGEWGWKGLVMSDWFGSYSTTESVLAGLDLEMPGPPRFRGEALKFNVSTDKVREHILDERAREVLEFVKKCAVSGVKEGQEERAEDTPETAALLRKIGGESLVLLKNEKNILPLKKDKKVSCQLAFSYSWRYADFVPDRRHWAQRKDRDLPRWRLCITCRFLRCYPVRRHKRQAGLTSRIFCRSLCPQDAPTAWGSAQVQGWQARNDNDSIQRAPRREGRPHAPGRC